MLRQLNEIRGLKDPIKQSQVEFVICDTPGFFFFFINIFEKEDLKLYYKDFVELSYDCKFSSCNHINEPGCAVKEALENGEIPRERYDNYLLFFEETLKKKDRF